MTRKSNANDVYEQVVDSKEDEIESWSTMNEAHLSITVDGIRVPDGLLQFDDEEMIPFKYFDYCEVEVIDNSSKKKVAIPFVIGLLLTVVSFLIGVIAINAISLLFVTVGIIALLKHESRESRVTKIDFYIGESSQSVRVNSDIEDEFRALLAKATRRKMIENKNRIR